MWKTKFMIAARAALLCAVSTAAGQSANDLPDGQGWQYLSPEKDGVYGIALDEARGMVGKNKQKKQIVVAVIGPGIDVGNKELQGLLRKSKKEKENGRDDDRNGKTDDIHGWNFLGGADGGTLENGLTFADREFLRLVEKYGQLITDGKDFYWPNPVERVMEKVEAPEDMGEYLYYNSVIRPASPLASASGGLGLANMSRIYMDRFTRELKEKFPDKSDFTHDDFLSLLDAADSLRSVSMVMLDVPFTLRPDYTWSELVRYMNVDQKEFAEASFVRLLSGVNTDDRSAVGDRPYDIKDTHYGNNLLMAANAAEGNACAALISSVGGNVAVMTLRTDPGVNGDPLPKDLALAIRYAVDNKADIIAIPRLTGITPYGEQAEWVENALEYAALKNILVILGNTDRSLDMDEKPVFPSRQFVSGRVLDNVLTVAASDEKGNPMIDSDFGAGSLDLFAPGVNILSALTDGSERVLTGSGMAVAVTAGVAALVKSQYPRLGGIGLRRALMSGVTDRTGVEVEKQVAIRTNEASRVTTDIYPFEELSVSKGILNAAGALNAARTAK